jgi:hypothetical protein
MAELAMAEATRRPTERHARPGSGQDTPSPTSGSPPGGFTPGGPHSGLAAAWPTGDRSA